MKLQTKKLRNPSRKLVAIAVILNLFVYQSFLPAFVAMAEETTDAASASSETTTQDSNKDDSSKDDEPKEEEKASTESDVLVKESEIEDPKEVESEEKESEDKTTLEDHAKKETIDEKEEEQTKESSQSSSSEASNKEETAKQEEIKSSSSESSSSSSSESSLGEPNKEDDNVADSSISSVVNTGGESANGDLNSDAATEETALSANTDQDTSQSSSASNIEEKPTSADEGNPDTAVSEDKEESSDVTTTVADDNINKENTTAEGDQKSETTTTDNSVVLEEPAEGIVSTGDAVSATDVSNNENLNESGQNFQDLILNIAGNYSGDINLLSEFAKILSSGSDSKNSSTESSASLDVVNNNDANVNNNISSTADSGNNQASSGDSNSKTEISTGAATASSDVVNFVNTNLTGANWLFAVINVFGRWTGNLIVPGEGLLDAGDVAGYTIGNVSNENDAEVVNNVQAIAETGANNANGQTSVNITTGDATASAETLDKVNTNITGDNWFLLLINNMGSWAGKVLGWDEKTLDYKTEYSFDLSDGDEGTLKSLGILNVANKNNATVTNNISASANTGSNTISADTDSQSQSNANITTGSASAFSNVVNFINTNVVGSNWLFGIVNIFGSWTGDVVFAYPDLMISISDGKDKAMAGEILSFVVSYKNSGDADAEDSKVSVSLPDIVSYKSDTGGVSPSQSGNSLTWNFSGLKAGETRTFVISAAVPNDLNDSIDMNSSAVIGTDTKELNLENNSSRDNTLAYAESNNLEYNNESDDTTIELISTDTEEKLDPEIDLSRNKFRKSFHPGDSVKHSIVVENSGNTDLYNVQVVDYVSFNGSDITQYQWSLDDMAGGKKMLVEYEMMINSLASPGTYKHTAVAMGFDENGNEVFSKEVSSKIKVDAFELADNYTLQYFYYTYGTQVASGYSEVPEDYSLSAVEEFSSDIDEVKNEEPQDKIIVLGDKDKKDEDWLSWLVMASSGFVFTGWRLFRKFKFGG